MYCTDGMCFQVDQIFVAREMADNSLLEYQKLDDVAYLAVCNGILLSLGQFESSCVPSRTLPPDHITRAWMTHRNAFSCLQRLHER